MRGSACTLMSKDDSVSLTLYGTLYLIVSKPTQMIDKSVNKYIRHATNRAAIRVISSVTAVTQQKQLLIITFAANLAKLKAKWNTFVKSECATLYIHREFKLNNAWMLPKSTSFQKKTYRSFWSPHSTIFLRPERGKNRHVTGRIPRKLLSPNQVFSHNVPDTRQALYPLSYGKNQTEQVLHTVWCNSISPSR